MITSHILQISWPLNPRMASLPDIFVVKALKILVKDPEPRVRNAAKKHHNWTMLSRAQVGASDLYKRIFKEELEAALRDKKRRNL